MPFPRWMALGRSAEVRAKALIKLTSASAGICTTTTRRHRCIRTNRQVTGTLWCCRDAKQLCQLLALTCWTDRNRIVTHQQFEFGFAFVAGKFVNRHLQTLHFPRLNSSTVAHKKLSFRFYLSISVRGVRLLSIACCTTQQSHTDGNRAEFWAFS